MLRVLAVMGALAPGAARADPVQDYILPRTEAFAEATEALAMTAAATCDADRLRPAWDAAMEAFLGVQFLRLGPMEVDGRALTLSFWPDPKGIGARQTRDLLAVADPVALTAGGMAAQSAAVRGLTGIERLVWADPPLAGDYPCALIAAVAADLAATAAAIRDEWPAEAELLASAGPGNPVYFTPAEAQQALFTQVVTGIAAVRDTRIARPLGTLAEPRPERAEARASGRALANITGSLAALRAYALALDPGAARTAAAFDAALTAAEAVEDPTLQDLGDPQAWLKLDILRQRVDALHGVVVDEIGGRLGVAVGFNAADGD